MAWEPETLDEPSSTEPPLTEVAPGFPVDFDDPAHVRLEWGADRGHFPHALTPLAGDYAVVVGSTLNGWQSDFEGFPQRWHTGVWHGYVYYAFEPNATPDEWAVIRGRSVELWRTLGAATGTVWYDDILPEVRSIYDRIDAVDADGPPADVAAAWESSWLAAERVWKLHVLTAGQIQVLIDLEAAYAAAKPGAAEGEAFRLIQGDRHELFEMELATERLAAMAAASLAVAAELRAGNRSVEDIRSIPGGERFVAALEAFLEQHGHLGQTSDDLAIPSWSQAPDRILDELAKRLDAPPPPAEERRGRLRRAAEDLAADARARLADRPEELAQFDRALAQARSVGLLSEIHNYWIDRAIQARMHGLAIRIGRRLVRDGVIAAPDDVFYLRRAEVPGLVREPRDARDLVAERRQVHERQRQLNPTPIVGTPSAQTADLAKPDGDAPEGAASARTPVPSSDSDVLQGMGASPGVVHGTARVVLGAEGFGRVRPGDIIICPSSNPSWVPVFTIAAGLVTNRGGILSHAAVVAREFGLPAVVGVRDATLLIADDRQVEIDGTSGVVRLL